MERIFPVYTFAKLKFVWFEVELYAVLSAWLKQKSEPYTRFPRDLYSRSVYYPFSNKNCKIKTSGFRCWNKCKFTKKSPNAPSNVWLQDRKPFQIDYFKFNLALWRSTFNFENCRCNRWDVQQYPIKLVTSYVAYIPKRKKLCNILHRVYFLSKR